MTSDSGSTSGSTAESTTETTGAGEGEAFVVRVAAGDCTHVAAEGVRVVMDTPAGERVEAMTDASGEASFEGLDFTAGTASVSVIKEGHDLVSYVGLSAERSPLEVSLWTPTPTVALVGNATNMVDTGHTLLVSSTLCSRVMRASQKPGVGYTIWVVPLEAFVLFAVEFSWEVAASGQGGLQTIYQWFWEEHEALTEDGVAPIMFSGAVSTEAVTGSFSLDDLRDDSPVGGADGRGYVIVREGGHVNGMGLGFPTIIDINAGATAYDYTVEHVQSSLIESPVTEYVLREKEPSAVTIRVYEPGLPRAGDFTPDFIDMPTVTPPAGAGGVYPLANQTWTLEKYDEGVTPSIVVVVPMTDFYWTIYGPEDATSIAIPALPEDAEHLDVLRSSDAQALVVLERGGEGLQAGYVDALTNTDAFMVRYE